jgi:hypothetical protein
MRFDLIPERLCTLSETHFYRTQPDIERSRNGYYPNLAATQCACLHWQAWADFGDAADVVSRPAG